VGRHRPASLHLHGPFQQVCKGCHEGKAQLQGPWKHALPALSEVIKVQQWDGGDRSPAMRAYRSNRSARPACLYTQASLQHRPGLRGLSQGAQLGPDGQERGKYTSSSRPGAGPDILERPCCVHRLQSQYRVLNYDAVWGESRKPFVAFGMLCALCRTMAGHQAYSSMPSPAKLSIGLQFPGRLRSRITGDWFCPQTRPTTAALP
jgi:hypothetical protein